MRCSSKRVFPSLCVSEYDFIFAYCCRLPPSSRLDQLAKHFITVQCDVVGLLDGLLSHLLTVHIELDFLWRDGDVELQEGESGWREVTKKKKILVFSKLHSFQLCCNTNTWQTTKNTAAFQKLGLAFISIWKGHDCPLIEQRNSLRKSNHKARNNLTEPL